MSHSVDEASEDGSLPRSPDQGSHSHSGRSSRSSGLAGDMNEGNISPDEGPATPRSGSDSSNCSPRRVSGHGEGNSDVNLTDEGSERSHSPSPSVNSPATNQEELRSGSVGRTDDDLNYNHSRRLSDTAPSSGSGSPAASPVSNHSEGFSPTRIHAHSDCKKGVETSGSGNESPFKTSVSKSPAGEKSESVSPTSNRSQSRSPARSRSESGSPVRKKSESMSPVRNRSKSGSPAIHRSKSRSPEGSTSDEEKTLRVERGGSRSGSESHESGVFQKSKKPRRRLQSASSVSSSEKRSRSRSPSKQNASTAVTSTVSKSPDQSEANVDELFGDADDISSSDDEESVTNAIRNEEHGSDNDKGDYNETGLEVEEEEVPETRIEVEIPKISTNLGKQLHFVKLPNFLSVETRPFDEGTYEDEGDEDDTMDEEGRARLKLKVENTMRWRFAKDEDGNNLYNDLGNQVKETNSRIVRWSDGSLSLHLGAEIFDIHTMQLQGDFNHLFVRQGTGLQGQAVFRTKLAFRPHSTDSFTHKKMTLSLADRSNKAQKVKVLPIAGKDPDAHRNEMIKKEEERLKASIRRESQQRRAREKANQRLSSNYLEGRYDDEENDDNAISIAAIKNKYKKGAGGLRANIYSSNSEDDLSDDDRSKNKRSTKARKLASDEEGTSESDLDSEPRKKKAKVSDDDDDLEADSD